MHVRHITEKLGASDRTQAVAIAPRRSIIHLYAAIVNHRYSALVSNYLSQGAGPSRGYHESGSQKTFYPVMRNLLRSFKL